MAPAPIGSGSNIPPVVSITTPPDGTNIVSPDAPVTLQLTASASDYDGSVTNVEFYAGATTLGQVSTSPYTLLWTIPASGSYQLTAVATDNQGATTVSAPVGISATVPGSPPVPALRIFPAGTNFALYLADLLHGGVTSMGGKPDFARLADRYQCPRDCEQPVHRYAAEHRRAALFHARLGG